jgi:hypothetical protein
VHRQAAVPEQHVIPGDGDALRPIRIEHGQRHRSDQHRRAGSVDQRQGAQAVSLGGAAIITAKAGRVIGMLVFAAGATSAAARRRGVAPSLAPSDGRVSVA